MIIKLSVRDLPDESRSDLMTLTRAPFQIYFAIVGQTPVYLALFILHGQYHNDLLFALASIFYLHGYFEGSPVSRGNMEFFLLIDVG